MAVIFVVVAILTLVVLSPVAVGLATHNRLIALDQRCDTAFADIDALLKHRGNLIPGLVETVRGYADHEKAILSGVVQARAEALQAVAPEIKLKAEKKLTQNITALIGVADRHPDLKASPHFAALREELVDAENRITAARRFYNLAVGEYDATLRQFPGSYVGRLRRMGLRAPFDLGVERVLVDEPVAIRF